MIECRSAGLVVRHMLLLCGVFCLQGCNPAPQSTQPSQQQETQLESPAPQVLARVDGEAITEAELDVAMARTFDATDTQLADGPELRKKMLESLVASRAMKKALARELDAETKTRFQLMAQAYEEELYVREYLKAHIQPVPVTEQQVEAYYHKHPELFGATTLREFEWLQSPDALTETARASLLAAVPTLRQAASWKDANLHDSGMLLRRGRSDEAALPDEIRGALLQLASGETSELISGSGRYSLVRVTRVMTTPARPLAEVSGDIRQRLAPMAVKDAIRKSSEQAQSQFKIEWTSPQG